MRSREKSPLEVVWCFEEQWPVAVKEAPDSNGVFGGKEPRCQTANNDGTLPFRFACNGQLSLKVLQFLVEMDPTAVETASTAEYWPLHEACYNDAPLDVVLSFVGMDPLYRRDDRCTWHVVLGPKHAGSFVPPKNDVRLQTV
jgi:hypothetical protein